MAGLKCVDDVSSSLKYCCRGVYSNDKFVYGNGTLRRFLQSLV